MNAKDFFEENKANVRELWNLSDSQKKYDVPINGKVCRFKSVRDKKSHREM